MDADLFILLMHTMSSQNLSDTHVQPAIGYRFKVLFPSNTLWLPLLHVGTLGLKRPVLRNLGYLLPRADQVLKAEN